MISSILLAGRWESPSGSHDVFSAFDPLTGQPLEETFPVSDWKQLERMADAAADATRALRRVEPDRPETMIAVISGPSSRVRPMPMQCLIQFRNRKPIPI